MARAMEHSLLKDRERFTPCLAVQEAIACNLAFFGRQLTSPAMLSQSSRLARNPRWFDRGLGLGHARMRDERAGLGKSL
jgi:hypothetical protein